MKKLHKQELFYNMLLFQQRAGEASCLPGRPEKEMGI